LLWFSLEVSKEIDEAIEVELGQAWCVSCSYSPHWCKKRTVDWTQILKAANIAEPPGRPEVIQELKDNPKVRIKKKAKNKRKR
jgi:hypothetical protein